MKAQTPARGIMLQHDFGDSKNFKVECDCSSDDHAVYMWIEVEKDKDMQDIQVSFYVTTWTQEFWRNWPARLRAVYDILVKGVHKQEHHMILSQQSATNFAHAITNTVKELEGKKWKTS